MSTNFDSCCRFIKEPTHSTSLKVWYPTQSIKQGWPPSDCPQTRGTLWGHSAPLLSSHPWRLNPCSQAPTPVPAARVDMRRGRPWQTASGLRWSCSCLLYWLSSQLSCCNSGLATATAWRRSQGHLLHHHHHTQAKSPLSG